MMGQSLTLKGAGMNLIEAIQDRCNFIRKQIIPAYIAIGLNGSIGKILLENDIKQAEAAIASGDVTRMISILASLRETCERAQ